MQNFIQKKSNLFILLGILLGIIYWQTLDNPLVFDDIRAVREFKIWGKDFTNPLTFFSSVFNSTSFIYERSTSYLTFYLINYFSQNLAIQRVFNIFIHFLNSILVFFFISKFYKKSASLLTAIFSLNPISIYSIAYLSQRNILLATFFSLVQIIFFIKSIEFKTGIKSIIYFAVSVISFLFAVSCKEQALMMIFIYPLLSFAFEINNQIIFYNLFVMVMIVITFFKTNLLSYFSEMDYKDKLPTSMQIIESCGINQKIFGRSIITQMNLFFKYMYFWMFPFQKTGIDMRAPILEFAWSQIYPFIIYVSTSLSLFFSKKFKKLGIGMLFAVILFFSELFHERIGEVFVLYRTYIWSLGYLIIIGYFIDRWKLVKWTYTAFLFPMIFYTCYNLDYFNSDLNLWKRSAALITDKTQCQAGRIHNNIGTLLLTGKKEVDEAIPYLKMAVVEKSNSAYYGLAQTYFISGQLDFAKNTFQALIDRKPSDKFLKESYLWLGKINLLENNYNESLNYFNKSIEIEPWFKDALNGQKTIFYLMGSS